MSIFNLATLAAATVIIAGALVVEHELTGRRHWPERWYYAEGLVTVLGGLLLWAALVGVTMSWTVAAAMLLAGCASGGPDWLLIRAESQRRAAGWEALEKQNADLAARLQLLMTKRTNSCYFHRLRDMIESLAFAAGTIAQEREYMDTIEGHAERLLAEVSTIIGKEKEG